MAGDCNEVLAGMLRPGNAGSNTATDHIVVLADAVAALPALWRAGHEPGDHPDDTAKELVVRPTRAAPRTGWSRSAGTATSPSRSGSRSPAAVRDAIVCVDDDTWIPAVDGNGRARPEHTSPNSPT